MNLTRLLYYYVLQGTTQTNDLWARPLARSQEGLAVAELPRELGIRLPDEAPTSATAA